MIPIFRPWPAVARLGPHRVGAPISLGDRFSSVAVVVVCVVVRSAWYVTVGQTVAPGSVWSRASARGSTERRKRRAWYVRPGRSDARGRARAVAERPGAAPARVRSRIARLRSSLQQRPERRPNAWARRARDHP